MELNGSLGEYFKTEKKRMIYPLSWMLVTLANERNETKRNETKRNEAKERGGLKTYGCAIFYPSHSKLWRIV